jgi:hypothetical protein
VSGTSRRLAGLGAAEGFGSVRLSVRLSLLPSSVRLSLRLFLYPLICLFRCPSVRLSTSWPLRLRQGRRKPRPPFAGQVAGIALPRAGDQDRFLRSSASGSAAPGYRSRRGCAGRWSARSEPQGLLLSPITTQLCAGGGNPSASGTILLLHDLPYSKG